MEGKLRGTGGGGGLTPYLRSFCTKILHLALFSSISRTRLMFPKKPLKYINKDKFVKGDTSYSRLILSPIKIC